MVRVKIPNYVVKRGRGFWQTTAAMREAGFKPVACGRDGPEAWRVATECNACWADFLSAAKGRPIIPFLPIGSLAEAFQRYRGTPEWSGKAPATREEWMRGWTHIEPVFGDVRPRTVILEHLSMFRETIEQKVSRREAHRVIKIWRALWRVAAAMGYCGKDEDPSQGVRNLQPEPRQALWSHREAVLLVKAAWRAGFHGLAATIAVAWDSSLSPVDVRTLTPAQRVKDDQGEAGRRRPPLRAAPAASWKLIWQTLGSRSRRRRRSFGTARVRPTVRMCSAMISGASAPLAFGPEETRTLADFRRSGTVEAKRGGATVEMIGDKLANDFASSSNLRKTYAPVDLASVRQADAARKCADSGIPDDSFR